MLGDEKGWGEKTKNIIGKTAEMTFAAGQKNQGRILNTWGGNNRGGNDFPKKRKKKMVPFLTKFTNRFFGIGEITVLMFSVCLNIAEQRIPEERTI